MPHFWRKSLVKPADASKNRAVSGKSDKKETT